VRYVSVPERLGIFAVAVGAAAIIYPRISHATGLGLPCPLRTLTGIPCPACGMTTASTDLVAGDLAAALAANPFVKAMKTVSIPRDLYAQDDLREVVVSDTLRGHNTTGLAREFRIAAQTGRPEVVVDCLSAYRRRYARAHARVRICAPASSRP
jgi:hypothetical protein